MKCTITTTLYVLRAFDEDTSGIVAARIVLVGSRARIAAEFVHLEESHHQRKLSIVFNDSHLGN